MTKLDEMIEEIADTFCGSAGCDSMGHGPGGCGLSKELRKFASEIVREVLPKPAIFNSSLTGTAVANGYRMAIKTTKQNARELGLEV